MRFSIASMLGLCVGLLTTGCVTERAIAAQLTACPAAELREVTKGLTDAEQAQADEVRASNAQRTVALTAGMIIMSVIALPLGIMVAGSMAGAFKNEPEGQGPRLWVGCGAVAVCHRGRPCYRAGWLSPDKVPELIERSRQGPFFDVGFSGCGEQSVLATRTGVYSWMLTVCGEDVSCFTVIDERQFACQRSRTPPDELAPEH